MYKLIGIGIVLLSTIGYASLTPLFKKASTKVPPFTEMAIAMFVLFVLSLCASIFFEGGLQKVQIGKDQLVILILAGTINFFAFWFLIVGFKYMPVWQQTMFSLLFPVIGGIFAYFLLGENISPKLFIGLAIMALGLFIAVR